MLAIGSVAELSANAVVMSMGDDVAPDVQYQATQPAADLEDLILLTDDDGAMLSITPEVAPSTGEYAVRDFIINAPDRAANIVVEYNAYVAFQIFYTEDTNAVSAGLNSNIKGPKGGTSRAVTNEVDMNGADVMTLSYGKYFDGSTAITLVVDQEQIGIHLAQIYLTNPDDTLNFEFDSTFTGNLHLIYDESEDDTSGETGTTKRAFVIQTAANVTTLSDAAIATLIAAPTGQTVFGTVLSEINLGTDSLEIVADSSSEMAYQVRIENFMNETPQINANIGWTSVSEHNTTDTMVPAS